MPDVAIHRRDISASLHVLYAAASVHEEEATRLSALSALGQSDVFVHGHIGYDSRQLT